jgi:ubiquinone/menaquinone biosynthesis C-methylase UbiE
VFDTVTVVAALNHIPNRAGALREAGRVLKGGGVLLTTMIGPRTGLVAHMLFHRDERARGGMRAGECHGIPRPEMRRLLAEAGFELVRELDFQLGLNRVYVARRP